MHYIESVSILNVLYLFSPVLVPRNNLYKRKRTILKVYSSQLEYCQRAGDYLQICIYQHLVGVRLVLISNTGCDLKSTEAGLSRTVQLTPLSTANWFPESPEGRSEIATDGGRAIDVDNSVLARNMHEQPYPDHRNPFMKRLGLWLTCHDYLFNNNK